MKATLEFNLPEEAEEHEVAVNGMKYKLAFEEVWERLLRPANKHGYSNERLAQIQQDYPVLFGEIIDQLAEIYREIADEIKD